MSCTPRSSTRRRRIRSYRLESEKVEKLEKGLDKGVGLRMIRPWQTFFASTNSKEEGRLLDLAGDLARAIGEEMGGTGRSCCAGRSIRFS